MWKVLRVLPFALLACAVPASAQNWSVGVGTGPFIFGKFLRRTQTITNGETSVTTTSTLSAATRAGLSLDVGRDFNDWLGLRVEGTWTEAPMRLKRASGDSGVNIDAGRMGVTTLAAPFVISLNRKGAIRFQLFGGPAYAMYDMKEENGVRPVFVGTRSRWGVVGGAAVQWWLSDRFAAEGRVQDIVTSSPIERTDVSGPGGVRTLKPQNVHTTVGIRYRF